MAAVLFSVSMIIIKILSKTFSGLFIALTRFIIGIVLVLFAMKLRKHKFRIGKPKDWILRGVFGAIAMITLYVCIQLASSARASLFNKTYPFFVMLFGYLFFKQRATKKQITSLALCILGILFIFYDGSKYSMISNLIGLTSGFTAGFAVIYLNKLSKQNVSPYLIYLPACLLGLIPTATRYHEFANVTPISAILIVIAGTTIFGAQSFLGYGHKHVTATRGSILAMIELPLMIILSYFIVNEQFTIKFFIGALLVVGGLLIKDKKINPNI